MTELNAALTKREAALHIAMLRTARRACDTSAISRKNTELRETFLTVAFEARLREEFARLGLTHLPLRHEARTQRGDNFVAVRLAEGIPNREVLSEGEMRALSLACFLAEVQEDEGAAPLVLDDPVSSLDHTRLARVADRLVEEAGQNKQVVVFTHSLPFYFDLWNRSAERQVPISTHWLRAVGQRSGVVAADETPWDAQKVRPRIGALQDSLGEVGRCEDQESDQYRSSVIGFYAGLRETWERLVEELLLRSVVERFRPGVQTQSLRSVEVSDDDYATIYFGMARASQYSGHDAPVHRELAMPSLAEMRQDLEALRRFADQLRVRAEPLAARRRDREEPPRVDGQVGA